MPTGVPVTVLGQQFIVAKLTLRDLNDLNLHIQAQARKVGHASVPDNLSDEELSRWIRLIREDSDTISVRGNAWLDSLLGRCYVLWMHLRASGATLPFVEDLMQRGNDGEEGATAGLNEISEALAILRDKDSDAKKNGQMTEPLDQSLTVS